MLDALVSEQGLLFDTTGLAAIALIGYMFGRWSRAAALAPADDSLRGALARAQGVADELRRLTANVGVELTSHQRSITAFQARLAAMETGGSKADWTALRASADAILGPTLKLTTTLTVAGDHVGRQHAQLSTFSGSRIDRATGLQNRRSLEERLAAFFSIHAAGKRRFSLALFSVGSAGGDESGSADERLRLVARLLEECIRDDDFVARYSDDEFVVLMPQTPIAGALAFSERLIVRASAALDCSLCCGVVEVANGESAEKLLSRADSALYSARAAGQPSLFQHTGAAARRHAIDFGSSSTDVVADDELAAHSG